MLFFILFNIFSQLKAISVNDNEYAMISRIMGERSLQTHKVCGRLCFGMRLVNDFCIRALTFLTLAGIVVKL